MGGSTSPPSPPPGWLPLLPWKRVAVWFWLTYSRLSSNNWLSPECKTAPYVYVCMRVCVSVCAFECVRERRRERDSVPYLYIQSFLLICLTFSVRIRVYFMPVWVQTMWNPCLFCKVSACVCICICVSSCVFVCYRMIALPKLITCYYSKVIMKDVREHETNPTDTPSGCRPLRVQRYWFVRAEFIFVREEGKNCKHNEMRWFERLCNYICATTRDAHAPKIHFRQPESI